MLSDFLCLVLDFLQSIVEGWLPTFSFDGSYVTTISDSINTVIDFVKQVNFIIPLPDIVAIIVIDVNLRIIKFVLWCINWVIRRVADVIP